MKGLKKEQDKKFIEMITKLDDEEKNIAMVAIECFALGKRVGQSKNHGNTKLKAG